MAQNYRRRSKFNEVAFIFPNAPTIPITTNGGTRMPGWYDIIKLQDATSVDDLAEVEDEAGMLRARDYFHSLIREEQAKGIASERIVIGGFSQGAAITLLSGATCPTKLGGIFMLSGYLPLRYKIRDMVRNNPNKDTKIFIGHGEADPLVKYEWAVKTKEKLKELGYTVSFNGYPGLEHSASPQEMDDVENFLNKAFESGQHSEL
ncbi:MAG: hypothetical protein M1840_004568 [Geoglossum simile]|nr:MAG: hypothetical protein M1840_004568 [Geoglossum simile]